jgi:heavy metal efflux system protein
VAGPDLPKEELRSQIEEAVKTLPGNVYEFSQPIQWRFNELIAGVRGDIAVKVFGEEFEPMLRAANQIAAILRGTNGPEDVKVEQVTGLPFLEIKIDNTEIARLGLSVSAVQEVIGAAIGGREAGVVFEGDRRFPIMLRLDDEVRENLEALKNLPVPLPPSAQTGRASSVLLKQVAKFEVSEGPNQISRENGKRRVVVTANVRGRDIASLVAAVQEKVAQRVQLPAGYWLTWGGQFENLEMIVVPGCFNFHAALHRSRHPARCSSRVQRRSPCPYRRRRRSVAARHAIFRFGSGWIYRSVGSGGAQWPRDGDLYQAAD